MDLLRSVLLSGSYLTAEEEMAMIYLATEEIEIKKLGSLLAAEISQVNCVIQGMTCYAVPCPRFQCPHGKKVTSRSDRGFLKTMAINVSTFKIIKHIQVHDF